MSPVPVPTSERWKPLRAGLVDVFYYDVEEFRFHDGRLLLRGNNGTGKSKVLALTLPFLLDGELSPHRVEPDGDRQKRMEWNLLLGGKHPHPERLGYTWLEFGRLHPDGTQEYRTLGCGLKAVKDRGIVRHWFFVTTRRVGVDLDLVSDGGVSLTREKLREAVDGHGTVYDRATDYRRAVDEALFGLGEHRYEALVNLLIQLRQPQLSKKPDERLLSRALTEALPPLSPALITTVAEAFRGLDEERDALRALEEAHKAATDFLGHYVRYARIAAKRKAAGPRLTQSRYEHLNRDLTEAETRFTAAETELAEVARLLETLKQEKTRLDARREALQTSPEMRDAERIEQMGQEARRRDEHAARQERDRDGLSAEAGRKRSRADRTSAQEGGAERTFVAARDRSASAAALAGCGPAHAGALDAWESGLTQARRDTGELAEARLRALAELERLLSAVAQARSRLDSAATEAERLDGELQAASERIAAADRRTQEGAAELLDAYVIYLSGLTEIRVDDPDAVLAKLEEWAENAEGRNPAATAVDDAAREATAALGRREADAESRLGSEREAEKAIGDEIERLESGGHDAPPVPYTRASEARTERPGAPLWKVVDFDVTVPADHRAGLEAALEASGILDSWVTPQGALVAGDDTFVLTGEAVQGPSCALVLRPAIDRADPRAAALDDGAVQAVLAGIGLGPGARTWIAVDGRWANGVLGGSWRKDSADFIGEGAREAARRTRIARLRSDLAETRGRIEAIGEELAGLTARRESLAAEHRAVPRDTALREAHVRLAEEHRRRRELDGDHRRALEVVARRRDEVSRARERATEFAGDVGLPTGEAELAEVRTAITDYRFALADLWPAAQALLSAREAAREAAGELRHVLERLEESAELAAEARDQADSAAERHRALVETAGAGVEELFRRLEEVRQALTSRDEAENGANGRERSALEERGKAQGTCERLRGEIEEATEARDKAVGEFRAFAATGVLHAALPELDVPDPSQEWAANPAVVLARAVNTELDTVDDGDGPWDRVQKRVSEEHKLLSDAMSRHGHAVGLTVHDGIMVVDVVFQGRTRDVPGLAAALEAETEQRAHLLSAREREILENHLLNEVAGTLQELIAAAEDEVREMNAELTSRPTSTGMRLRLVWKPARDAPDGLDRVREKLRQTIDAWSVDDRAAVGRFLQEQIAREHADNPASGWTEQLTRALDYRSWHMFTIQRLQDGQWRPATGPASGGERVLAASVPLFAAASAHYKSAGNPHAPRLVALDEAFAGVDDDSRAKCLGLLATFDMDVVMTSEREWGCYPQVPGLSICQLSRRDGIDAVLVTPWRWDGRELTRADLPEPEPVSGQTDIF
ncbi:TIGR02680 family protein [Actinomadura sp. 7K507]|uniref:TIGR02680 family protein n=1 Tax=Actinomadura sp. 7K507 TaxID=2530365 RepID=UPI00104C59EE|nr:TIGR02680 family protein [Actinomadura sp. 7K507]TDC82022.1 TIGR02680 family protein [Actinomadura sp. 7K507]